MGSYHKPTHYDETPKPYTYEYGVHDDYSGAHFGQNEYSDGKEVKGQYTVALPDGRTQIVDYHANHYDGYIADVKYEGYASYPKHQTVSYKPAPVYHKPAPVYHKPAPVYHKPAPAYHA